MEFSALHFARPLWLLALIAIPFIGMITFFYKNNQAFTHLEKFIDKHLLPYLLVNKAEKISLWKYAVLFSVAWTCLTLALAGPRWEFREIETFSKDQSLAIVLDLSESMNADDVKPSRLIRAKQKIEDLINDAKGVKIGLVAFAADPHMITPLTEDMETVRHLLPTLDTGLVYVQGSKLAPALEMAATMLEAEPGTNKAILVISDGGFEDASAIFTAKKLSEKGILLNAMGMGTLEGAPIKNHEGNLIKKNGSAVITKLERERIQEISTTGNGRYLEAHDDEDIILKDLGKRAEEEITLSKKSRLWEEHFYWLLFPVLPIMLWWFRRGFIFALFLFLPAFSQADYFKNSEQIGLEAFDLGDYQKASQSFQDPYRKGVAYYKAGNFAEAEKMFLESSREDVESSSRYNLGNAYAMQQKFKEAITAYEEVLKKWPDHVNAKENLELLKKMQEEQQKEQQQKQDQQSDQKDSDSQESEEQKDPQNSDEQKDSDSQESKEQKDDGKEQSEAQKEDNKDSKEEEQQREEHQDPKQEPQQEENKLQKGKSLQDHDADILLNKIEGDPKGFMKNKFYIESKKNGTREGVDPW